VVTPSRPGKRPRKIVACLSLAVAALLAVACGSSGSSGSGASSGTSGSSGIPSGPVKIGVIVPLSGTLATIGEAELNGVKVAVKLQNAKGGIDGHQIDLLSGDDQGTPAAAVSSMQSLAGQGVKFFVAGINSPICQSLAGENARLGTLEITLTCFVGNLINPTKYPTVYRANETNESITAAAAYFMCKNPDLAGKATTYDYIGVDDSTSVGQNEYLQRVLAQCNIKQGNTVYTSDDATDMLPYVSDLLSKLPANSATSRVLVLSAAGAQLAGMISTGVSSGLYKKYSYVIGIGEDTELFTAQTSLGKNMPLIYQVNPYFYGVSSTLNSAFLPAYKALTNTNPPVVAANGFISATAMISALEKAKSTDVSAVNKIMVGLTFPAFQGTETFLPTHEGTVPELMHTFGPAGPQFVANATNTDVAPFDTPADHQFAVEKGI
jgi:branched-chain amino acid transport system substrate-binding protein